MSATFQEPQKANFLPDIILGQEASGGGDGGRKAEQAWPFFGRTAHWPVCHSVPSVFPSSSNTRQLGVSSDQATHGLHVRADKICSYRWVLRAESRLFGSLAANVSVFDACVGLHQQGHSDRKSVTACCTLMFSPTCHLEDVRRIKRKHRYRLFPSL